MLEGLEGYEHERLPLSTQRRPLRALPSIAARRRAAQPGGARRGPGARPRRHERHPRAAPTRYADGVVDAGLHLLRGASRPSKRLVRRAVRGAVRASAVTICTSQLEHDELAALVEPRPAAHGDRGGADTRRQGGRRRRARRASAWETDHLALFAAELEERKDPLGAVEAVRAARREGADLVLLVAGEGSLRPTVQAEAGDGIRVLGFRHDVGRLMSAANLFVLPSNREGLSLALLEAMSRSLVPVVAAGAGNPEAVGDTGIVVPPGDVDALAVPWPASRVSRRSGRVWRRRRGSGSSPSSESSASSATWRTCTSARSDEAAGREAGGNGPAQHRCAGELPRPAGDAPALSRPARRGPALPPRPRRLPDARGGADPARRGPAEALVAPRHVHRQRGVLSAATTRPGPATCGWSTWARTSASPRSTS